MKPHVCTVCLQEPEVSLAHVHGDRFSDVNTPAEEIIAPINRPVIYHGKLFIRQAQAKIQLGKIPYLDLFIALSYFHVGNCDTQISDDYN